MGASNELLPLLVSPLSLSPKVVERGHPRVPSPPSSFGALVTRLNRERAIRAPSRRLGEVIGSESRGEVGEGHDTHRDIYAF